MSIFLNTQTALVQVYAWGAGGGGGNMGGWIYGSYGGGGGFTSGKLLVKAGDVYQITVGGGGFARVGSEATGYKYYTEGGGGSPVCTVGDNRYGGWGGGLTGVFLNYSYTTSSFTPTLVGTTTTAVLIAGGGGGGGAGPKSCQVYTGGTTRGTILNNGGAGGGFIGQTGVANSCIYHSCGPGQAAGTYSGGLGGTQYAGGAAGYGTNVSGTAGRQFLGGKITPGINPLHGGGGGGWFGGGSGGYTDTAGIMAGGGGGSGYINPALVYCGVSLTGNYAIPGCSTNVYRGCAGNGGLINATGQNGRVVITYPGSQIASGGVVTTSSGTTIHTFSQSGAFSIYGAGTAISLQTNLLIVGGGGGGGDNMGGGGGGGAAITAAATMTTGVYQITVGNGGSGNSVTESNPVGAKIGLPSSVSTLGQNSYSYLFQSKDDYLRTYQYGDTLNSDNYGYGTSRVHYQSQAFTDRNFTLEGWYWMPDAAAPISRSFFNNYGSITVFPGANQVYFGKHDAYQGRVSFWAGSVSPFRAILVDPQDPPTGKWVHYAVSRNNTDFTLFRDGAPVAAYTTSSAITSSSVYANWLGMPNSQINYINTGTYRGYMSNVRMVTQGSVYTTGVSAANTATTFSGVFNGISDYLTVNKPTANPLIFGQFLTSDFTIELWAQHTVSTSTNVVATYVEHLTGGITLNRNIIGKVSFGVSPNTVIVASQTTILLNTWYHIAVSRSGTTTRLFINGILEATNAADSTNYTSSNAFAIGGNSSGGNLFTGYMHGLRVVAGLAVYTGNFTLPTSTLSTTTNASTNVAAITTQTILLTLQNSTFKDNSLVSAANGLGNNVITTFGTPGIWTNTPFSTGTVFAVPTSPLTNVQSSSTNINAVIPRDTPGYPGSILFQPANAEYVQLAAAGQYAIPGDFTIECWINLQMPPAAAGFAGIIGYGPTSGGSVLRVAQSGSSAILQYWINGSGNLVSGTTLLVLNRWYHVALQRSGVYNNVKLYLNGAAEPIAPGAFQTYSLPTSSIVVGKTYTDQAVEFFNGLVSNIRISRKSLYPQVAPTAPLTNVTNTQLLLSMATAPTYLTDSSPNNYTSTAVGTPLYVSTITPFTSVGSIYFDGSGNNFVTTAINSNVIPVAFEDFTIEFWFNQTTHTQASPAMFSTTNNGGNTGHMAFFAGHTSFGGPTVPMLYWVGMTGNSSTNSNIILLSQPIVNNQWAHVAITRSSGTFVSVFYNGALGGIGLYSGAILSPTNTFWLGTSGDSTVGSSFNGYISNFRVVKGTALYSRTFTPSTSPLTVTSGTWTTLLLNTPYINSGNPELSVSYTDSSLWKTLTAAKGATTRAAGPNVSILSPYNNTGSVTLLTANSPILPADYSLHSFNLILNGNVTTSSFSPFYNYLPIVQTNMASTATIAGYSAWFDGMGSRSGLTLTTSSNLHLSGDFNIEFWMYASGGNGGPQTVYNNAQYIINKGEVYSTIPASYQISYAYPDLYFSASTNSTTVTVGGKPSDGYNGWMGRLTGANTWNHVAVSRKDNTIRGFVNGVQGLTTTTNFSFYDTNTATRGLAIGIGYSTTWASPSNFSFDYTGLLSNLRIIKNQALYTGNFTPPVQTLNTNTVGTSGANVVGSVTGTTSLLMFNTPSVLNEGSGVLFTSTSFAMVYFAPIYPQSINPFGPSSTASTIALAMGGGSGASIYNSKAVPASTGANGGGAAACHWNGGSASPGIMGIPGGGYAGAVSTGSLYTASGGGAASAGYVNGWQTPGLGKGGCGIASNILGTTYYFGGGGGSSAYSIPGSAGNGGIGGGGGGAPKSVYGGGYGDRSSIFNAMDGGFGVLVTVANVPGGNGAPNSGGGGGGASHNNATWGGWGGSGIVVISYPGSQKALGGVVTTVGTTTVHAFYSSGIFTVLPSTLYPQALGGAGGAGYAGGGGGAAGMGGYGGAGGNLGNTGTSVFFGGGGAGGASSATIYASGGGGAGISALINKVTVGSIGGVSGQSGEGGGDAVSSGFGAKFGGGAGGGVYAAVVPCIGSGGSGALLIVYNTSTTTYGFPNPSQPVYAYLNPGTLQYPYGQQAGISSSTFLILTTSTTCRPVKTWFSDFAVVPVDQQYGANLFKSGKNTSYIDSGAATPINITRNIVAECVSAANLQITTFISSHCMMMKNNDRSLPVAYNTPGNYQVIQEVNTANDPRLVNARVQNFIVGVTGNAASTGTAGTTVNQYWNGS